MAKETKEPKAPKAVVKETKEPKADKMLTVSATYKVKNEEDGTFERVTHKGTGETLADAVAQFENYPEGLTCNVLVTAERGGNEVAKNLAPHNARAICEDADEYIFERNFRGV